MASLFGRVIKKSGSKLEDTEAYEEEGGSPQIN